MARPDRVPVLDALGVVPHPVAVDHDAAGPLGDADHPAVDVRRHPGEHPLRRSARGARASAARTSSWSPPIPPEVTTTAWADSSNSPSGVTVRRDPARRRVRREHRPAHAGDGTVGAHEVVDPVPEPRLDPSGRHVRPHAPLERRDDAGTRAPGDVEPRHRVAGPGGGVPAALGPADDREQPQALLVQPRPLLARREVDVRLRPAPRPVVLRAVEPGRALPSPASASSAESLMPIRRCSGESTRNSPPNDHQACPPRSASPSWSSSSTRRPASAASAAATSPARPAPTTTTSASMPATLGCRDDAGTEGPDLVEGRKIVRAMTRMILQPSAFSDLSGSRTGRTDASSPSSRAVGAPRPPGEPSGTGLLPRAPSGTAT